MTNLTPEVSMKPGITVSETQILALRRHPDRLALECDGQKYTYREMEAEISKIAQLFKSCGIGRGDSIGLLAANRPEVIFANWAAQSLGVRYTPLHPRGSEDDHAYVIEHAKIQNLIVDCEAFADRGRALQKRFTNLQNVFTIGTSNNDDLVARAAKFVAKPVVVEANPQDICNILFTGGTTGKAKGAIHSHGSIVTGIVQSLAFWEWPAAVRFLIATPISHAAGSMLTPTLIRGGSFHVMASFDPHEFLKMVERERITATFLVPSMIYDLLDKVCIEEYDLSSLEMIIYGASPISTPRLKEAIQRFGPKFCQLYGQTEAPNMIAYLGKNDHDLSRPHLLESCGVPLAPNQIKLIMADGREAGPDEAGEICVRGPLVMEGYWENTEETEKALKDGWLHTGDVARMDEQGYLYIVDRVKDMVISGGFNIFTREVEDCLAQHPSVAAVAVIGIPHERWGEAVAAFLTLKPGTTANEDELIALVRDKKGPVQAPKTIEFLSEMPLTAIGKIDKKALRSRFWSSEGRAVA